MAPHAIASDIFPRNHSDDLQYKTGVYVSTQNIHLVLLFLLYFNTLADSRIVLVSDTNPQLVPRPTHLVAFIHYHNMP